MTTTAMLALVLAAVGFSTGCAMMQEDERSLSMEMQKRDNPAAFETELQRQERERNADHGWSGLLR